LNQTLIQERWDVLLSVMATEQHTQEIAWFLDQLWDHFEHIP
jgi:hypothetical protein